MKSTKCIKKHETQKGIEVWEEKGKVWGSCSCGAVWEVEDSEEKREYFAEISRMEIIQLDPDEVIFYHRS